MVTQSYDRLLDKDLQLKDAGLIAADDICQVASADKIIDLGASGRAEFDLVVDVTACEIASNDENYKLILQGSNDNFSAEVVSLHTHQFGALETLGPNCTVDTIAGRTIIPVSNAGPTSSSNGEITHYRYLRLAVDVSGTIATGINFVAWLTARGGC